MNTTQKLDETTVLRFPAHAIFRFDQRRQCWVILIPEKLIYPDEIAVDVLRRIDGNTSLETLVAGLAEEYDAPRDVIFEDVHTLLTDFVARGVLTS